MATDFDEFVAERLSGLLRYATVLTCDPDLAQDVVQEVLLRAQQRWPKIGGLDAPGAYVQKMVTNEYLSWRRRRAARDVSASHEVLDALAPAATDQTERFDERDELLARIAALPRRQRAALVLRYYEGRTDDEIAELLGCGAGTVRSHVSRGLAALRGTPPPTRKNPTTLQEAW